MPAVADSISKMGYVSYHVTLDTLKMHLPDSVWVQIVNVVRVVWLAQLTHLTVYHAILLIHCIQFMIQLMVSVFLITRTIAITVCQQGSSLINKLCNVKCVQICANPVQEHLIYAHLAGLGSLKILSVICIRLVLTAAG